MNILDRRYQTIDDNSRAQIIFQLDLSVERESEMISEMSYCLLVAPIAQAIATRGIYS
jgi:hypothetical protein